MTNTTAVTHLTTVIDRWADLTDMLTTRHGTTWPPAGRMTDHIRANEAADTAQAWADELAARALERIAERTDSRYTLGESPAPLRLGIVDTMRTVERDLVYLADVLAQEIQRQPMAKAPAHWLPADRTTRDRLAAEDAADWRRWRYRENRTATAAAVWLLARVEHRPGPFLQLSTVQLRRIEVVAKGAAGRTEQALDGVRAAQVVDRPCPLCGGVLGMASGDGAAPVVACFQCQQEWTLTLPEVA